MAREQELTFSETQLKLCAAGAALLLVPNALTLLEKTMFSHVLIEFPLLVGFGVWLGSLWCKQSNKSSIKSSKQPSKQQLNNRLLTFLSVWNKGGIPGILLASFALAFWMIPRWLDASLVSAWLGFAKYACLIFLVGVPLAWSWPALHFIARGVVKIEFLTMLFRLGWLYLISPNRLCNSYLLTDQLYLGYGFLLVGVSLAITWLIPPFMGSSLHSREGKLNAI